MIPYSFLHTVRVKIIFFKILLVLLKSPVFKTLQLQATMDECTQNQAMSDPFLLGGGALKDRVFLYPRLVQLLTVTLLPQAYKVLDYIGCHTTWQRPPLSGFKKVIPPRC